MNFIEAWLMDENEDFHEIKLPEEYTLIEDE